jgi:hypothetical protein
MKKVIRLTESDLINIVKRVINESDEKSTFESEMQNINNKQQLSFAIHKFFENKTEMEINKYFMELSNRKPKPTWIQKLINFFKIDKNKNKKINTKSIGKALMGYSILFMLQQIFKIPLPLPSKPVNEHKRPHYGDNKTVQYAPIQNFINLGKIPGLSKNSSGDAYLGKSGNFTYTFKANGTNGNGTYYVNNKPGQWRFDNDSTACASNLPNCRIFKGVKLITPVSSK